MTLLTIAEAADRLRVSVDSLRLLVKKRAIGHRRGGTGGKTAPIYFAPEDLAEYLEAVRVPAKERPAGEMRQLELFDSKSI
jgi:excisionase family DNA binding protein